MLSMNENSGSVKINGLVKVFGKTKALDDISFEFSSGQVHGFIGPNGAGKTTTMRILSTLDTASDGNIEVMGLSMNDSVMQIRKIIGFVPDWFSGFDYTTVHEYLDFFARAYGLRGKKRIDALGSIEEFTGLVPLRDKLITELSRGMQQRVCFGRALINEPKVMLLDEPAANLDPRARIELRELVKALAQGGKAVLISSHILAELSEICDSVTIIDKGKILASGKIQDIKKTLRPHIVLSVKALCEEEKIERAMLEMPGAANPRPAGQETHVDFFGDETELPDFLKMLIEKGIPVSEFKSREEGLEDIFMKITGQNGGQNK
jgi:ABC-2 type transport system ATP-binding protein